MATSCKLHHLDNTSKHLYCRHYSIHHILWKASKLGDGTAESGLPSTLLTWKNIDALSRGPVQTQLGETTDDIADDIKCVVAAVKTFYQFFTI